MALLTSPIGITPSFSPCFSIENSAKASFISFSSAPVMLCSLASLDCRAFGAEASATWARRLAGFKHVTIHSQIVKSEEFNLPFQMRRFSIGGAASRDAF